MIYGAEAWTLRKAEKEQIESAEMWFYRRILIIKRTKKLTSKSILEQLSRAIPRKAQPGSGDSFDRPSAHRSRYGLAKVLTLGLRSIKTTSRI